MSLKVKSVIAGSAILAVASGYWLSSVLQDSVEQDFDAVNEKALAEARKYFTPIQGTMLSPTRKIAVPELLKDNGEIFTLDDLSDQWHILFFGYTHCPDICPTTMGVLAQAKKTAKANNHIFPEVVFISVDPARDKVETLGEYVRYFDKEFIGVTGDEELIKALALQMSVVYMKMSPEAETEEAAETVSNESGYLVDHSSALLLLNPEARLVAFLNPPHDPATILKDFQTVVNQSNLPASLSESTPANTPEK